jgi:hypothetical protein
MALPKLSVPEYELELPSNQQKVRYRPFLVKEQKILMIAEEGKDEQEIVKAIKQIISACTLSKDVDISSLPLFDIEYFFLQLRSKSIGEKVKLFFRHQICPDNNNEPAKNQTEIEVDLNKVKVIKDKKHKSKVELTKDIGLVMKHPKIDLINKFQGKEMNDMANIFRLISECIDQVYDADETYNATDYTPKELEEFISDMTEGQFKRVQEFFETMPKLKHKISFKCIDCKYEDTLEVEGLQNFFT